MAYVDCDLANHQVPVGQANIAYSAHPDYRGRGYVSRAVRVLIHFLENHTEASEAHFIVDETNVASLRVAQAVGAKPTEQWVDDREQRMVRHVLRVSRSTTQ